MRRHIVRSLALALALVFVVVAGVDAHAQGGAGKSDTAQKGKKGKHAKADTLGAPATNPPKDPAPLFRETQPFTLTLTANFRQLKKDRGENPPWRPATLAYKTDDGKSVSVPLRVHPRGIWRLKNCDIPPLRFNFTKDSTKQTAFAKLDKPKLVSVCKDKNEYDEYILEEYQLYRVLEQLTPLGFLARLAKISYVDSANGTAKPMTTRWGFITEDGGELSQRTGFRAVNIKGATRGDIQVDNLTLVSLFQYMIGNTDYSISALHNVQLLGDDTATYAVPYDFDWTGAVNPPYAFPNPTLGIRSVEDRLYRGYCVSPDAILRAIALFSAKKEAIYALYQDDIGKLMPPDRRKRILDYFDDFYKTIGDPNSVRRDIIGACLGG